MNIFRRVAAGCLALAMLAGCAPATPSPSPTVGGYAETEITPPDSKDWTWKTICADEDGRVHIFGVDTDSTAEAVLPRTVHHEVYENDEWQTVPADWSEQLAELCPALDTDGLYSITFGVEEDCVWTAVSFTASVNMVQDEKNDPDGNRLWLFCEKDGVLEGGEVLLHDVPSGNLYFSGAVQCGENLLLSTGYSVLEVDRDGNLLNSYAGRNGALQEDGTVVWEDENTLVRYPHSTNTAETPDWEQVTAPNLQMTSRDGTAYLLSKSGFFRAKDTTMEQLGESRWLRVGNANFMPLGLAVVRDDLFYLMESIGRVYRYEYDPEYTVVEEEIKVVSVLPNKAVETAITELAREHREITVDYQYLIEDKSTSDLHLILSPHKEPAYSYSNYEDVVRSLYASIAAGDGPDVLILDDLDAAALIQQGMLADLNEFVDTSVVYPVLCEPFAQDGKQYGLPTWFYPWLVTSRGDMPKMDTFDDFKNAVLTGTPHVNVRDYYFKEIEPGHYVSTDEPTSEIPEGVHFSFASYGDLFPIMYLTWKQQLLTGDRAVIEAFLLQTEQLGKHVDAIPDIAFPSRYTMSWQYFLQGDTQMACAGMISTGGVVSAFTHSADEPLPVADHAALLPDTQGNTVCQPGTVAAIPANSQHKEAAALFIEALLSETVHTDTLFSLGLPAVPEHVQIDLEQSGYNGYGSKTNYGTNTIFTLEENPAELCGEIDLCIPDDPVLESRFLEEADAYLEGQKTLDEAVDSICNMMQTMQAEQQ